MNCKEIETRLNALLDDRRAWQTDAELAAHLHACTSCRRRVARYEAMLAGVDAITATAPSAAQSRAKDFSARVVRAAGIARNRELNPRTQAVTIRRTVATVMMVATMLLVATGTVTRLVRTHRHAELPVDDSSLARPMVVAGQTSPAAVTASPSLLTSDGSVVAADHQRIWLATGRNLATIPVTVRRIADWSDEEGLVGAIRPLLSSFNETVAELLRFLPGRPARTELPNGDTSRCGPVPPLAMV